MARNNADEPTPEMKGVIITADHVYLPLDEEGNAVVDWQDCPGPEVQDQKGNFVLTRPLPIKVAKRTRLKVPADLAAFLSKRDQAEIV
jgi:hypothetical protein